MNTKPQFAWLSNEEMPFVTVDSHRRIYFNTASRRMLDVKPYQRWLVGYDIANRRLILAKPDVVRAVNVVPFSVDLRFYLHAKKLIEKLGIVEEGLPLKFYYLTNVTRGDDLYPAGSYVFQAEDGGADGYASI